MGVSQTVGGSSDVTIPALIKPWYAGVYFMLILGSKIFNLIKNISLFDTDKYFLH